MGGIEQDPFAIFTAPPPGETPEEKAARERREAEAQRVSDRIDEELKAEKALMKRHRGTVKVLLLGQSESGKSTTLKNFRLKYARAAWKQERASWRLVIQLNLIRSINIIVEILQAEIEGTAVEYDPIRDSTDSVVLHPRSSFALTEKHQLLRLRLGPLRRVEADLKRRLGAGSDEVMDENAGVLDTRETPGGRPKEFCVRGWKNALENPGAMMKAMKSGAPRPTQDGEEKELVVDEATEVISSCKDDIKMLWSDEVVQTVLAHKRVRLEDSAGFFLHDLDRIATRNYEPSDDDVVRARLRTLGVQEYRIQFDNNHNAGNSFLVGGVDFGNEWLLYDVGGARTLRHAWLPFFDTVNAIIFPISCFDERLLEDPTVNRLEDSFLLWRAICSSKLLRKTTMILFLNKCDILKRKLRSGVMVRDFLPSYGDRLNDAPTVLKYLKEKFKDILKNCSPEPRVSYFYGTSVTDTKATATTLKTVRDSILREHLKNADFV
ncbi:G-protein alpha subunit [Collybia nuda]|uniref:G-protein alpha subunit n=1 Tax=Collybia nuda TaxID=64659 RepID=A0A9P5XVS3_9AGAR|nr:G-protein alpha subunit [Collybia nuda]